MAITVRFPNGQAVRYNDLSYVAWQNDGTALLQREKNSGWSVHVPKNALIELCRPCSVSNPLLSPEESIDIVLANLRSYPTGKLNELKAKLAKFDRRTYQWRD